MLRRIPHASTAQGKNKPPGVATITVRGGDDIQIAGRGEERLKRGWLEEHILRIAYRRRKASKLHKGVVTR